MKNTQQHSLWNPVFLMALAISVVSMFSVSFVNNIVSLYVVEELNGSPAIVGEVYSLMILCAFLFRPFAGYLVDKLGRRKTLLAALILTAILNLSLTFNLNISLLYIIRFLSGIPFALKAISLATLVADALPKERMSEGIGINAVLSSVFSSIIAPILSYWMLDCYGFRFVYSAAFVMACLALLLIVNLKYNDVRDASATFSLRSFFEPSVLWIALIFALLHMANPIIHSFVPLYALELGLSSKGLFFLFYGGGSLVSLLINRYLARRNWPGRVSTLSILLYAAGFCVVGLIRSVPAFLAGGFLVGIGFGLSNATFNSMAMNLVEAEKRGKCNATTQIGMDLGTVLGSNAFGRVAQYYGSYQPQFSIAAVFMLLPLVLLRVFVLPHFQKHQV